MIREATPGDIKHIVELWERCGVTDPTRRVVIEDGLAKKLEKDPDLVLVWEEEEKILGAVLGVGDPTGSFVRRLAVDESKRGAGVGTRLTQELMGRLERRGVYSFAADVEKTNLGSLGIFRKLGFEIRSREYMICVRPFPTPPTEQK